MGAPSCPAAKSVEYFSRRLCMQAFACILWSAITKGDEDGKKEYTLNDMNSVTNQDGKTCGINDMNCLEAEEEKSCDINNMNCLKEDEKKSCGINNMNCEE